MEVKRAEFARRALISRQLLNFKVKKGLVRVNAAGLIDTDNAINNQFLSDQQRRNVQVAPAQLPPAPLVVQNEDTDTPSAVPAPVLPVLTTDAAIAKEAGVPEELLDLPLRDLIIRYGGIYGLERQAKIYQQLTAANDRYQRTQERGLKLIPKDVVQGTTIQFLKTLSRQVLEYPEGAADDLIAKVQAHGADAKPEIILVLKTGIGRIINGAKEEIIRDLEVLKGKYSAGDKEEEPEEARSEFTA